VITRVKGTKKKEESGGDESMRDKKEDSGGDTIEVIGEDGNSSRIHMSNGAIAPGSTQ